MKAVSPGKVLDHAARLCTATSLPINRDRIAAAVEAAAPLTTSS